MADLQELLAALDVFSRGTDKAQIDQANIWLLDFQHSVNRSVLADLDDRLIRLFHRSRKPGRLPMCSLHLPMPLLQPNYSPHRPFAAKCVSGSRPNKIFIISFSR